MRSVYADLPDAARYAGFWIRVFANVLDGLLFAAVNQLARLGAGAVLGSTAHLAPESVLLTTLSPLVIVLCWMWKGTSPGKWMCGLRIVDEPTGGPLTPWQCVGRYVMGLLAVALGGIGYAYLVIDPRKQGLHDKIVRTLVVYRT
jgi:uncharacterized RDD family membrane protein YckC